MASGWAGRGCVSWEIQVKIRSLLTAGAVAAVATVAALAAPTIASAANGPAPAINVVQPASPASFDNSSGTVATGTVSGVIPARGTSLKKNAALAPTSTSTSTSHAAAAVPCGTEPDCNLPYGGGPVQHTPHVYLVFWGPKWGTNTATENFVKSFFTGLGQPTDYWSTTVQQYSDKTGHPTFGKSVLVSTYWDNHTPEKNVNNINLGTEAAAAVNWLHISDPNNADVVIAAQQGTCFAASGGVTFAGNCGTPQQSGYCAFHDWDVSANPGINLPWVNLPYQPDAGVGCGQTFINSPGTNDGYSITGGHELMEAITDPIGTGWVDNADTISGGEVADKCAWGGQLWGDTDPAQNVTFATGTFAMQSLWSNAVTGCVMNGGLPLSVFDGFRAAYLEDRAQFFLNVASGPFFNFNRAGAKVSQGLIQSWWMQGMMCGHKNGYDCIKAFSETDFTEDLKKFDVPTLIVHGDDDQIVPIDASARLSAKLVKNSVLKIYPGGSHSLGDTSKEQLNKDLLEFAKA